MFGVSKKMEKLYDKWYVKEKEYTRRKEFSDDLEWILTRMQRSGESFGAIEQAIMWAKLELKDAVIREEELKKKQIIQSDERLKLTHAIEILEEIKGRMPSNMTDEWMEFAFAELERETLEHREFLDHVIVQIQLEFERLRKELRRKKPDWNKAGEIFMPIYDVLILRTIKHEITTNVAFLNELPDAISEFKDDSEAIMTETDLKRTHNS